MKVFLCAQKSFGAAVLEAVIDAGHTITGVAPPPQDRLKDKVEISAIKRGLPIVSNCDKLRGRDIPAGTEIIVAAHSHWFISAPCRASARYGAIGFHPSLLPRHRGIDAVRWTALCGDPISGGTVFKLDDGVDTGPILLQRFIHIGRGWDYHKIWSELFPLGVEMIIESLSLIRDGAARYVEQNADFATWEPAYEQNRRLYRPELLELGG